MSDIATKIAQIQKELIALKTGFAGDERRFTASTVTEQSFTLSPTKPLRIIVDFEYTDFPQLFTQTYSNTSSFAYQGNLFTRKNLYEWWLGWTLPNENYTFTCTLLSEKPPTLFTLVED